MIILIQDAACVFGFLDQFARNNAPKNEKYLSDRIKRIILEKMVEILSHFSFFLNVNFEIC